jgi:hypothetical protein
MTNEEIYKIWKHGEELKHKGLTPKRVYNALKSCGLQVVLVKDCDDNSIVYNYVPEEEKFYHVYE